MLIIPFDRALDWRRPPVVTLLLLVINILCYFVWQAREDQALDEAITFYADSGLAETEYPYLAAYYEARHLHKSLPPADEAREAADEIFFGLLQTPALMDKIRAGTLIPSDAEGYEAWRSSRGALAAKLAKVTFLEYGLKTAEPTWKSLLAHMFLHADFMHLFGNMFFLLAVGLLVETVLDSRIYLLSYLLAGLGSTALNFVFTPDSYIPGIGASGAIAGLMGMLTVLYWTRPVRFFYFLFVYFDFIRLPAIVLLPLWIGNELFQMFTQPHSNINFLAHVGGLCAGAAIGWMVKRTAAFSLADIEQQDQQKADDTRLEKAFELCRRQDYKAAIPLLRRLNSERPGDLQILFSLYDAERIDPSSEEYHQVSHQIFGLAARDAHTAGLIHGTFRSYVQQARPKPRLKKESLCRLIGTFSRCGKQDELDRIALLLAKSRVQCKEQKGIIQWLHDDAERNGQTQRVTLYRQLLGLPQA